MRHANLTTNATAAGQRLRQLGVEVYAELVGETAHASESETLMEFVANARMDQKGRAHAVFRMYEEVGPFLHVVSRDNEVAPGC